MGVNSQAVIECSAEKHGQFNSAVFCVTVTELPPVTGSIKSQALQSAITGIHNLALQIRHFTMNLPFCLSLDLELSAGN